MQSEEIRRRFLAFFEKRGHKIIPSASLVPENDSSVLFTTAGMQPLIPYLLGKKHPQGQRLVNIQKCIRTQDIDEVGDNTHDTFFEMLGNWSLGDYFKEDAIKWSFELLTSKENGFGLDPKRLYVTVFGGNKDAPQDLESFNIWKKYIPEDRIYFLTWNGKKEPNWWDTGDNGPCGPDTEMFYDVTKDGLGNMTREEYLKADEEQKVVEVWNDVFMEYVKKDGKVVGKLEKKNVDTGSGLERVTMAVQGKDNIFDTDLLRPVIDEIEKRYLVTDIRTKRIVADHARTAVFMIADGVIPSNTDRGYILRRILRRAIFQAYKLAPGYSNLYPLIDVVIEIYRNVYKELEDKRKIIHEVFETEEIKFMKTLERGIKEFNWRIRIDVGGTLNKQELPPSVVFELVTTYGFPFELVEEEARARGMAVDKGQFQNRMEAHKLKSRVGAEQKFKGGLAGHSEMEVKYHTATHLLHQALREVLGKEVFQKGSNITPERLRFDFSFTRKMTDMEKKKVENLVNNKIKESLPISYEDIALEEAKNRGVIGLFEEKYGDKVRVYKVGDFSLELCGGPHVENTSVLGKFKIIKEEAISTGTRRIKAILK